MGGDLCLYGCMWFGYTSDLLCQIVDVKCERLEATSCIAKGLGVSTHLYSFHAKRVK